jgi:hypothetical protein
MANAHLISQLRSISEYLELVQAEQISAHVVTAKTDEAMSEFRRVVSGLERVPPAEIKELMAMVTCF